MVFQEIGDSEDRMAFARSELEYWVELVRVWCERRRGVDARVTLWVVKMV